MCRALRKTSTHFNKRTKRKNHSSRYPKSAPPREEKMSSPEPMVSEAMTAPGPKMVSHFSGLRDRKAGGIGGEPQPGVESTRELIPAGSPVSTSTLAAGRPPEFSARESPLCG